MPQPVRFSRHIHFQFSPDAILQRPKLAPHIGVISQYWNEIDARIGVMLAAVLGSEAKLGIAIYYAITNDGAKRAALDAIARQKLLPNQREEFQKILSEIGQRYGDRNQVVHGAWGISNEYPNALLLADIKETMALHADMVALSRPGRKKDRDQRKLDYQNSLMRWTEQDFLQTEERLEEAYTKLYEFTAPIIDRGFEGGMRSARPKKRPPTG